MQLSYDTWSFPVGPKIVRVQPILKKYLKTQASKISIESAISRSSKRTDSLWAITQTLSVDFSLELVGPKVQYLMQHNSSSLSGWSASDEVFIRSYPLLMMIRSDELLLRSDEPLITSDVLLNRSDEVLIRSDTMGYVKVSYTNYLTIHL